MKISQCRVTYFYRDTGGKEDGRSGSNSIQCCFVCLHNFRNGLLRFIQGMNLELYSFKRELMASDS